MPHLTILAKEAIYIMIGKSAGVKKRQGHHAFPQNKQIISLN